VKYLDHVISEFGIGPDEDKIACIQSWPFPQNVSELRSFLGLCSSFCPNFSMVAEPLTEMLRKAVPVVATEKRLEAFNNLKRFLTNAPVLGIYQGEGQIYLDVDASNTHCGACCQQMQNGRLRVLEYASRTFNRAERNYCTTRRELCGLVFGLRHFRPYLLGRKFVCSVDHLALTYIRSQDNVTGQLARHLDFMADFDFDLVFRDGKSHTNADSLSRLRPCEVDGGQPCKQCHRRVIGKHVYTVQTRSHKKRELLLPQQ